MPLISDQAVCIRHWDWSETSQTVSLFSRSHGVIRGIAKGSRREKSTFSGGIELMTRGEVVASLKNSDSLTTLTAWDLQETFSPARATLKGFYAGMAVLDVIQHSMMVGDPHPSLFDSMLGSLRAIGTEGSEQLAVTQVLWRALAETGHAPDLGRDVLSGEELAECAVYGFRPGLGGFSQDIKPPPASAEGPMQTMWKVRVETLEMLKMLGGLAAVPTAEHIAALAKVCDAATSKRCIQLLLAYFRYVFSTDASGVTQFVDLEGVGR